MSTIGLKRRATVLKYNGDGTVTIRLDGNTSLKDSENTHTLSISAAFIGPNGEFMGMLPPPGTSITVSQGQGEWHINGYTTPDNIFTNGNTTGSGGLSNDLMGELTENRMLLQTYKATNRFYLDPDSGIHSGAIGAEHIVDNQRKIITHNLSNEMAFTSAHREINGTIKRDLDYSSIKGLDSSVLDSQEYDDNLHEIGMDPTTAVSISTVSGNIRNLPLTEKRSITYELENLTSGLDFQSDKEEANKYLNNNLNTNTFPFKTDSRATAFSLNLHYPNHLIENIDGTGVDSSGNILDINRNILPIGRDDKHTFIKNEDNIDAFREIRAAHRRSIAHHFELNARKGFADDPIYEVPKAADKADYARSRSTYFFELDKEGQFKMNVPMSSETGNIPLPVRYVNASVLAYENGDTSNPNDFITEEDSVDVYLESFANAANIKINGESGEIGPIDRFTDQPIRLGTVHHDITNAGFQFTHDRITQDKGGDLIRYMPDSLLNSRQDDIQVDGFLTKEIYQSGPKANAGGRSGMANFDGMLTLNIGANTVDRQSLWVDMAGSAIVMHGRDKNGLSYLGTYDGDVKLQIGGVGIGATRDLRFYDQNDGARSGSLDIRVLRNDGQLSVIRIDDTGTYVSSPGRVEISAQQDLILKSNTKISMEAPLIGAYTQSATPRWIKRNGVDI